MKANELLNAIEPKTRNLWYKAVEKYGKHSYVLAVNGLGVVVLTKGYSEEIAKGNREVQLVLNELLKAEKEV